MAGPRHLRAAGPKHARGAAVPRHVRRGSSWRLVLAPFGAVLLVLLPIALVIGLSGPGPAAPSLAAPGQGLDASAALPAPTCGALGVLSSLVGHCPGVAASPTAAQDVGETTACNPFQKLFNLCGSSGELGWFLLALAITEAFHLPPPTTTTSTTTTSSTSTTTTSSTSTTTTSTTSTTQPPTSCSDSAPPIAAPSGSWSCTFDDEFNGTSLDTTKWHAAAHQRRAATRPGRRPIGLLREQPEHHLRVGRLPQPLGRRRRRPPSCARAMAARRPDELRGRHGHVRTSSSASSTATSRPGPSCRRRPLRACRRRCGSTPRTRPCTARGPTAARSTTASSTRVPDTDYPGGALPRARQNDPNATNDYCSIAGAAHRRAVQHLRVARGPRPRSRPTSTACPASPTPTRPT